MSTIKRVKHNTLKKKTAKAAVVKENRDKSSKVSPWVDDYISCFGLRTMPATEAFLERIAEELVEWAKRDDSVYLEDFCLLKGFDPTTLWRWEKKNASVSEAYKFAKMAIGSRTYKGALYGKMKESTAHFLMPYYSQTWMNMKVLNSQLKDNDNAPTQITVNMTPF